MLYPAELRGRREREYSATAACARELCKIPQAALITAIPEKTTVTFSRAVARTRKSGIAEPSSNGSIKGSDRLPSGNDRPGGSRRHGGFIPAFRPSRELFASPDCVWEAPPIVTAYLSADASGDHRAGTRCRR